VKVVADLDEAIAHIREHGTQHSDAILTRTCATPTALSTKWILGGVRERLYPLYRRRPVGLGAEVAVSTRSCTRAARWAWKP
jgi:glutamate-5-semialdehyde dehydrogenase